MSFYLKLATANTLDLLSYVYLMLANAIQLGRVNAPELLLDDAPEQVEARFLVDRYRSTV